MEEEPPFPGLEEFDDDDVIEPKWWRPWLLGTIAALLVALLVLGPVTNLFERAQPQVADNGLQICSFDYCEVQATVRTAGHGATMAQLAGTVLDPEEAQALADHLVVVVGERGVTVEVVAGLPGSLAGRYAAGSRVIEVEEPIRAWVIVHEVAHTKAAEHGSNFMDVLLQLTRSIEQSA